MQLQANILVCNGMSAPMKHHRAALFLDGLIGANRLEKAYSKAEFLAAWATQDPLAAPDRKAISRVVNAVRNALSAALPEGADRLEVDARSLTTGPWRLRILSNEVWQVDGKLDSNSPHIPARPSAALAEHLSKNPQARLSIGYSRHDYRAME